MFHGLHGAVLDVAAHCLAMSEFTQLAELRVANHGTAGRTSAAGDSTTPALHPSRLRKRLPTRDRREYVRERQHMRNAARSQVVVDPAPSTHIRRRSGAARKPSLVVGNSLGASPSAVVLDVTSRQRQNGTGIWDSPSRPQADAQGGEPWDAESPQRAPLSAGPPPLEPVRGEPVRLPFTSAAKARKAALAAAASTDSDEPGRSVWRARQPLGNLASPGAPGVGYAARQKPRRSVSHDVARRRSSAARHAPEDHEDAKDGGPVPAAPVTGVLPSKRLKVPLHHHSSSLPADVVATAILNEVLSHHKGLAVADAADARSLQAQREADSKAAAAAAVVDGDRQAGDRSPARRKGRGHLQDARHLNPGSRVAGLAGHLLAELPRRGSLPEFQPMPVPPPTRQGLKAGMLLPASSLPERFARQHVSPLFAALPRPDDVYVGVDEQGRPMWKRGVLPSSKPSTREEVKQLAQATRVMLQEIYQHGAALHTSNHPAVGPAEDNSGADSPRNGSSFDGANAAPNHTRTQPTIGGAGADGQAVTGFSPEVCAELSVWSVVFFELVRQVFVGCEERGVLLEKCRLRLFELLAHADKYCMQQTEARLRAEVRLPPFVQGMPPRLISCLLFRRSCGGRRNSPSTMCGSGLNDSKQPRTNTQK